MKSGDGAAGDGDEAEREDFAGEDGPGAIDEAREARASASSGRTTRMPDGEQRDDAELHEGAEVIARREQQPDGQRAGEEAVDDDARWRASSRASVKIGASDG